MENSTAISGWWQPGKDSTAIEGLEGVRQALIQTNSPIYVIDMNGKTGGASRGAAFIGKDSPDFSGHDEQLTEKSFPIKAYAPPLPINRLGDTRFKDRHALKYPYIAGAMANGITSTKMVISMARAGMTGFFGAGGLSLGEVENALVELKNTLRDLTFGCNLIHSHGDPELEMAVAELYLKYGVNRISAAAFMRITEALVYYRLKGIFRDGKGLIHTPNHIIAKVSRIEVARQFFSPPPIKLVNLLLYKGLISKEEAELSRFIPMAQDLTAEADSGGHTDNRPAIALFPTMISLRDEFNEKMNYQEPLCVGFAGGISTPESAAAAFQMGAAYILTGSVNQSCMESGTSEWVRKLLCQAEQADVAMAPAADMFEIGARVQVLKRGTMFAIRAEKLYHLYKTYADFNDVPALIRQEVEEKILQDTFENKWQDTKLFFKKRSIKEIQRAEQDPRHKMSLVFRSYLGLSSRWSITGEEKRRMDYQIWCGPAMGAFNQWVKGSFLENHENRKAPEIALNLLMGASICTRAAWLRNQGIDLPGNVTRFSPMTYSELSQLL